jgi:hypothetical protein
VTAAAPSVPSTDLTLVFVCFVVGGITWLIDTFLISADREDPSKKNRGPRSEDREPYQVPRE